MKIEVALTQLGPARLVLAFPHDSYIRPGVGDMLIERLAPYVPRLGIMLVSDGPVPHAYAPFETHKLLPLLANVKLSRYVVDLSQPPDDEDDDELPF